MQKQTDRNPNIFEILGMILTGWAIIEVGLSII